jgi:hypothetical protein
MGILSVWDRSKGWRDCMDRIPGHPHSIETIVPLSDDIVATGSSDGMIRLVSILPSSLSECDVSQLLFGRSTDRLPSRPLAQWVSSPTTTTTRSSDSPSTPA